MKLTLKLDNLSDVIYSAREAALKLNAAFEDVQDAVDDYIHDLEHQIADLKDEIAELRSTIADLEDEG